MASKKLDLVGESRLRIKCARVNLVQVVGLLPVIRRMVEICLENDGAAIAAPQVGLPLRFFVAMDKGAEQHFDVLFNPTFKPLKKHGKKLATEGCLSYPDQWFEVERWDTIKLSWHHWNEKTNTFRRMTKTVDGFLARMAQHEINHLDGVLIPDIGRTADLVFDSIELGKDSGTIITD